MAEPEVGRVLPLWLTVVLGVAGTAVAVWGIHAAAPILGPIVLAFVLTVVAHPIIGALVRRGVRRAFAIAIAVLVVDGGLIALRARPRLLLRPARDRAARVLRRVAAGSWTASGPRWPARGSGRSRWRTRSTRSSRRRSSRRSGASSRPGRLARRARPRPGDGAVHDRRGGRAAGPPGRGARDAGACGQRSATSPGTPGATSW